MIMYVELLTPISGIKSSKYWCWESFIPLEFKIYATNTDPTTLKTTEMDVLDDFGFHFGKL